MIDSTISASPGGQTALMSESEPHRVNIRTRIAVAVIVLVVGALVLVGAILFAVQRAATEVRAIEALERAINEFETLATQGVDPATGQPFTGPERLLEVALQRAELAPTEGELGVVDGEVRWQAPEQVTFRPEQDRDLLASLLPLTGLGHSSTGELRTPIGHYRYFVMPVVFDGVAQRGALIRLIDLHAELDRVNDVMRVYILVSSGCILLVAAFTSVIAGRLLLPIERLQEAAAAIHEDDLATRVPVTGSDDLTALTVTINGMLGRIQSSVEAQRRLLDDVGHELRTPVTVIRGHLELMDSADPADVTTTRQLALEELDRMGGLVNDLITLAKSDGPDFVIPQWVDVAELTDATLEKARALGRHRWRLSSVAAGHARLDRARITQAWLQLAANANKYSEPDSLIELGSRIDRDQIRLWVRDEGIGIAAEDMDLIRARFGRSHAGRAFTDGAGLGLSIVGSIVRAHGGRLDIESKVGAGSIFTMVLPIDPASKDRDEHNPDR